MSVLLLILASCSGDRDLKNDAENIAKSMCRNIETMNKLKACDTADHTKVLHLQLDERQAEIEMTILYKEFKDKYKEKVSDKKFSEKFAKELRRAMLNCPYLSKEDRANFEKELENK